MTQYDNDSFDKKNDRSHIQLNGDIKKGDAAHDGKQGPEPKQPPPVIEIFNVASPSGYQNKYWAAFFEFVGTAFLLLAVNWGRVSGATPQGVSLTVFSFGLILGPISGGHFNPAVTVALFFRENKRNFIPNLLTALLYIVAQILGGCLGVLIALLGLGMAENTVIQDLKQLKKRYGPFVNYLCPDDGCGVPGYFSQVVMVEMLLTFFFASTVVSVVKWDSAKESIINMLIIALSLFISITAAAGISGGAINPAVAIVQPWFQEIATVALLPNFDMSLIYRQKYHGAYVLGTFLGGILAGLF